MLLKHPVCVQSGVLLGPSTSGVGSPRASFSCLQPEAPAAEASGLGSSFAGGFCDEDTMGIDTFYAQQRMEEPASSADLAAAFDSFDDGLPFVDELDFVPPPNDDDDDSLRCSVNGGVLTSFPSLNLNSHMPALQPPPYALNRTRRAVLSNRRSSLPLYDPRAAPYNMYPTQSHFDSFDLGVSRPHSWTTREAGAALHPFSSTDTSFFHPDLLGAGWAEERAYNCLNSSTAATAAVSSFNSMSISPQPLAPQPLPPQPLVPMGNGTCLEGLQNGFNGVHRAAAPPAMVPVNSNNLSRLKTGLRPLGRSNSISASDIASAGLDAPAPHTDLAPHEASERMSMPPLSRLRTTSTRAASYSESRTTLHAHSHGSVGSSGVNGPSSGARLSIRNGGVSKSQLSAGVGSRPETPRTPATASSPSAAGAVAILNNRNVPSFGDLVSHGFLTPGSHSFTVGNIEGVEVEVDAKGNIHWAGVVHLSLSSFALAVLKDRNPDRRACDGWREVRYNSQKLVIMRKACLQKMVELGEV